MNFPTSPQSLQQPPAQQDGGFTLVEVLVSIGLMGIGLTSVLSTFVAAQLSLHESRLRERGALYLLDYSQQIGDQVFDELREEFVRRNLDGDFAGMPLLENRGDEIGTVIPYGNFASAPPEIQQEFARYIFLIEARAFYNSSVSPHIIHCHLQVRWEPYLRTGGTIRKVERVIPLNGLVSFTDN